MRTGVTNDPAPTRSLGESQFGLRAQPGRHQLGVEGDLLGTSVVAVVVDGPQLDSRQRLAAVADHQVAGERVDAVQPHVVAVLDQGALRGGVARPAPPTSVKFTALSLCRIRNRSSPPTIACSTEYSMPSRRGSTVMNSASGSAASA